MARGTSKSPGRSTTSSRRQGTSPAVKSPMTPGWTSAKASMFLSPKSISPVVSRRVTRRSSVYQTKTTKSLTGRKSPSITKTKMTKEVVIGEVAFKAPAVKSKRTSTVKSSTSTSPALTRSRRSSVYHKAAKSPVSSPLLKSPPKARRAKKATTTTTSSPQRHNSPLPIKAPVQKVAKSAETEISKIPKPVVKSSPKKAQKKTTPKQKTTSPAVAQKGRMTRRNRSASKSPLKKLRSPMTKSPAKKSLSPKKATVKKVPAPQKEVSAATAVKAKEEKTPSQKRSRSPSKSPARKKRSVTNILVEESSPVSETYATPVAPVTPRVRSSKTPLVKKSSRTATPASNKKVESMKKVKTPSRATPAKAQQSDDTPRSAAARNSPVVKTPLRSATKKTPSKVQKTPSVRKTPSRGKSPAKLIEEVIRKSAKKAVKFSPVKSTPTSGKTELKRMPTPFVKTPTAKTPVKAVKVLGITPRSANELKTKRSQRLSGRTPPRTSTPMGDRKRQAVFDPEVSTIRVKRTRKSTVGGTNTSTIAEEDTMAHLNVNNNADDSAMQPGSGWLGWCTIL